MAHPSVQGGNCDTAQVTQALPDPALVVLVGPSGSGKSTWAATRYRTAEIVSSDALRGVVGSGEHDLDASVDAFALLEQIIAARIRRGLTTVVDTLGMDAARRGPWRELARAAGLPGIVLVFGADAAVCRARNRARDRPVPASVLDAQLQRMRSVRDEIAAENWDLVLDVADAGAPEPTHTPGVAQAGVEQSRAPSRLGFVLQISRFPWADDPAGWLRSVVGAAAEAGFEGIALMDHLIQVPQVGRAWEPIPEPWVTLGLLAGLTGDLRLGTLVTPVTYRAPGILAKTVATLDALSGGRAFCGIGAGWFEREHAAFGLPVPACGRTARPTGDGHRDAACTLGAGHQTIRRRTGLPARDDVLPASRLTDPADRRRFRLAHARHRRPARRRLQRAVADRHPRSQTCRAARTLRRRRT